jgi:hypothetical protein
LTLLFASKRRVSEEDLLENQVQADREWVVVQMSRIWYTEKANQLSTATIESGPSCLSEPLPNDL